MFVIDKNKKIILTKGDTASMFVEVKYLDNTPYNVKEDDTITLTVKKTPSSAPSIVKQAGEQYIVFKPEDTSDMSTGLYTYDIQLENADGDIYTIVPESFFQLTNEVS